MMTRGCTGRTAAILAGIVVLAMLSMLSTHACTVFVYGDSGTILFGNNEDYALAEHGLWTLPATVSYYGCVFFGYDRYAQGGINSAGLCFDATGIETPPRYTLTGTPSASNGFDFCQAALRECATIDELEVFLDTRYLDRLAGGQFLFADASGASLVLTVGENGQVVISSTEGAFRVITNFNVTLPTPAGFRCSRYETVTAHLEAIAAGVRAFSIESFANTLDAVHISVGGSETMYSNVFDLTRGLIYLYFQHDFSQPVVLSVDTLVEKPYSTELRGLFE